MNDEVFPGTEVTYDEVVRVFCEKYVFPPKVEFMGEGVKRDKVVTEMVDRDGNSWWVRVRARYSGTVLGIGVAERVWVEYDNGKIGFEIGKDFKIKVSLDLEKLKERLIPDVYENERSPTKIPEGAVYALQSRRGFWVRAEEGGGDGRAANPDADKIGEHERFVLKRNDDGSCSLQTKRGRFLRAEDGGGNNKRVQADANEVGTDERFWLERIPEGNGIYALKTKKGFYLRAEEGGGRGGNRLLPDANKIGEDERFKIHRVQ